MSEDKPDFIVPPLVLVMEVTSVIKRRVALAFPTWQSTIFYEALLGHMT
jgi:hypothetical protein